MSLITLAECIKLKEDLAMNFWDAVKFDGADPKLFPVLFSNLRTRGLPTNEHAIVVKDAINALMSQILRFDGAILGAIISSKKGRYAQSGFELRQGHDKEWVLYLYETEVKKNLYHPMMDIAVNDRLDGMSILQIHALIAILEVIPTFAKQRAA